MDKVICPSCNGTGTGSGSIRQLGMSGAGGVCRECRGEGEVSREKRDRIIGAATKGKG